MQGEVKKVLQDNIDARCRWLTCKARVDPGTLAGPTGLEARRWGGEKCCAERRRVRGEESG